MRDARSGAFFSRGLARGRVADGHACADIHPAVLAHRYQHAHWGIGGSCSDRFGRGARSHPDSVRAPLPEPCWLKSLIIVPFLPPLPPWQ